MSAQQTADAPPSVDPTAILTRQLSERAATDPVAAMLLARMQSAETPDEPDRLELLERRFDALLRANQQLREALVAANRTTAWVARLTGACPQCWGLAPDCADCAGRGIPGFHRPDVDDLVDWLAPALQRAGLAITAAARGPQHDQHTNTEQETSWHS